jgi:hypothetical protein
MDGKGAAFAEDFVKVAADPDRTIPAAVRTEFENEMKLWFDLLRQHGQEFGYRTAHVAARLANFYHSLGQFAGDDTTWFKAAMDCVVVQKFLPKLNGSRSKLEGLLWAVIWACGMDRVAREGKDFAAQISEASAATDEAKYSPEVVWSQLATTNAGNPAAAARYPISFDKAFRMWQALTRDQFVSFSEA